MEAAGIPSLDGWYAWRLPNGTVLNDLRHQLAAALEAQETNPPEA